MNQTLIEHEQNINSANTYSFPSLGTFPNSLETPQVDLV